MPEQTIVLPSMRVDGKWVLVTGAGRGIGRGAALALAEAGASIIALSRTAAEIEAVVEIIRERGGQAEAIVCDVTDSAQLRSAFAAINRVDILVNNAGISQPRPFLETSEDEIAGVIDLNVKAATLVAQAGAKMMVTQQSGVIINLSSTFGKVGRGGNAIYSGSKHFIEGLTKSLALELAGDGVRVVAIGPTAVITPMTAARFADPEQGGDLLSRIPLGRFGEVEDCVGAIVFLASPAASLITGVTIMVDGGWTAQ
ncbi:MAG: SDR family oxidoreductase [Pseudomonadota bacterium]